MRRKLAQLIVLLTLIAGVSFPATVSAAYNPFSGIDCNQPKVQSSAVCKTRAGDPVTGPTGVLRTATSILALIAGVAAVFVIVLGGIRYITSNGDAGQISQAKKTIIYAVVGLIVIMTAQYIINLVLSRI